jgi:hypothetical protein
MSDRAGVESSIDEQFAAVVEAAGGADRPDWLATAVPDPHLRERLDALATAVASRAGNGQDMETVADAYQAALAPDERASAGHFVTDTALATALCRWAIQPRPDDRLPRVLDPATGSGAFAVAAADRLETLAPETTSTDRLQHVVGIDRDPVSLALTAGRLLDRTTEPGADSSLSLYETDFFDVTPTDDRSVVVDDDGIAAGTFDAVVGNPPYVRQETADTERMRSHLGVFGPEGEQPYLDGESALSRRSDAYVYFVTHATRFLREGGRLAVVVPGKWLTTRYGEPFQQFLLDYYRLAAVVGFESRAFSEALVDTVLLLAERTSDPAARRATPTRFLRLDEQQSVGALLATLEVTGAAAGAVEGMGTDDPVPTVDRGESYRAVTVKQGTLAERGPGKRAHYLDAPEPLIRLLADAPLRPLGDLGTVRRGVMTGANDFFFLDADSEAAGDIADRFLTPAIKSIRDVDDRLLAAADTDRYLLDVHEYVTGVNTDGYTDPAAAVLAALDRDGYDGLHSYIERGEREGYHERSSCATRPVWFDLGPLSAPAVFLPKFFDRRVFTIANPDDIVASNAVDCLDLAANVDDRLVLGLCNSTVTQATLECWGRSEGGGALQLLTYEMATLPVPDPDAFAPATRDAITEATAALLDGDERARDRLDDHVLTALGVDMSIETLRDCRQRMVDRRVDGSTRTQPPLTLDE